MLSVSVNSNGATVVTPGPGDHVIYVSNSTGNDKNNGLTPATAVQTLSHAEGMLRDHTGDEMLLKSGDTWNTPFGYWGYSGASAQDPMLIGSYGSGARPTIMTGTASGFVLGRSSFPEVDYLDLMNINFIANGRDPNLTKSPAASVNPTGIEVITKSNDILIENCEVQYFAVGMTIEKDFGELQNVSIRRNIIVDSYATTQHSQGLYALGVDNLTLDGNVFDSDGFNNQVSGATATWYNQDCYLAANNTGCVIENNIFARAAGYGLQDRPGGIVKNNVFIDDPVAMTFGLVNGASTTPGGVSGSVTGNLFFGGADIGTMRGGQALVLGNLKPGVVVSNNIFSQSISDAEPAIALENGAAQPNADTSVGINSLTLSGNILYDWTYGIDIVNGQTPGGTGLTAFNKVTFAGNFFENITGFPYDNHNPAYLSQETFTNNEYYNTGQAMLGTKDVAPTGTVLKTPIPFANPTRSIASYDSSTGGSGSVANFMAAATKENELTWNPVYSAPSILTYFDAGFAINGKAATVTTPVTTPTPTTTPAGTPATNTFDALQYSSQSGGMAFDNFKGLGYINGGGWIAFDNINFGTGVKQFSATIAAMTGGGTVQLRLDSPTGTIVGTLKVAATGAWSDYTTQTASVSGATGLHTLYLVFTGGTGVCNLDTFTFS